MNPDKLNLHGSAVFKVLHFLFSEEQNDLQTHEQG